MTCCIAIAAGVGLLAIGMFITKTILGAQMNAGRMQVPPPRPAGSRAPARPQR